MPELFFPPFHLVELVRVLLCRCALLADPSTSLTLLRSAPFLVYPGNRLSLSSFVALFYLPYGSWRVVAPHLFSLLACTYYYNMHFFMLA